MFYIYRVDSGKIEQFTNNEVTRDDAIVTGLDWIEHDEIELPFCHKVHGGLVVLDEAEKLTHDAARVRRSRNDLLLQTDWWAVSDRTMTQAQIDYRQTLRDIPEPDGFPEVTWPQKP